MRHNSRCTLRSKRGKWYASAVAIEFSQPPLLHPKLRADRYHFVIGCLCRSVLPAYDFWGMNCRTQHCAYVDSEPIDSWVYISNVQEMHLYG